MSENGTAWDGDRDGMRSLDVESYVERLRLPYETNDPDVEFVERLGIRVTELRALHDEIDQDIDSTGVAWWRPVVRNRARVHLSDHLLECVSAVSRRLADARLHLIEMSLAVDDENRVLAAATKLPPERLSPFAELPGKMARLHAIAVTHSVQAAFDCLGAAVVGVGGLATSLRKADLQAAERAFSRLDRARSRGEELQLRLHDEIQRVLSSAGPPGWRLWAEKIRHGYAHRPEPLVVYTNVKAVRVVEGRVVAGMAIAPRLPAEPDFGQLEAFDKRMFNPLAEDARKTLNGVIGSTNRAAEEIAGVLRRFWVDRRADPSLIEQPERQWSEPTGCKFSGYDAAPAMFDVDQARVNPSLYKRMERARIGRLPDDDR